MSVVKPIPNQSSQSQQTQVTQRTNQKSKQIMTWKRRQAWENGCEQVANGWIWCEIF